MKTANQQQKSATGRSALGLSLLARMLTTSSLQTVMTLTKNRISDAGSKAYRAIESARSISSCPQFAMPKHQYECPVVSFYGSDWNHATNIRGGNP